MLVPFVEPTKGAETTSVAKNTAKDVASWMAAEVKREGALYQDAAAASID
jgi:hypothetical protein